MSAKTKNTYRMPAEWERHEATWISWPHASGISFPDAYEKVLPTFVRMAEVIAESEILRINVASSEQEATVKKLLTKVAPERVEFFHIPTNEPWCRDHGPIFVTRKDESHATILDFGFNAWGWKYSSFEEDDEVPLKVAKALNLPVIEFENFVLEGGSIEVNGAGTLLTTEACLLNPNRNPDLDRSQIEAKLKESLGVSKVLWLGDGIEGDDTDGHIDDLTRFVAEDTVVTVVEEDENDPNFDPLQMNLSRLEGMKTAKGNPLNVIKMPMPAAIHRQGLRLPASYANFYIANESVLLPVYHDANDAWAESVLKDLFPTRKVVPIDCRELIWGLGAFHCLTQQQPAV